MMAKGAGVGRGVMEPFTIRSSWAFGKLTPKPCRSLPWACRTGPFMVRPACPERSRRAHHERVI